MPISEDRIDLPLDTLIAENNQRRHNQPHHPRGQNRHSKTFRRGGGPTSRPMNRHAHNTVPFHTLPVSHPFSRMEGEIGPRRIEVPLGWTQEMNREESTKLYVSNLDYDVTNRDIELLFSEAGQLEKHSIHYDKSGRSKGTAEVVYKHHTDALAAIERYNGKRLDGKKLEIKLVGLAVVAPVPVFLPPYTNFLQEQPTTVFQRLGQAESKGSFHDRGGVGIERGRRQVRNGGQKVNAESQQRKNVTTESQQQKNVTTESRKRKKSFYEDTVTFDDLDADLEKYRLEARSED